MFLNGRFASDGGGGGKQRGAATRLLNSDTSEDIVKRIGKQHVKAS